MSVIKKFDFVVIGGGMVGAAAALSIAQLGLKVALVESKKPEDFDPKQSLDLRVSAISLASEYLLTQLEAWQQIKQWRSCAYQRLGVWEKSFAYTEFNAADIEQPHLGHIIENRLLQLALWQQISNNELITLYCPQTLQTFEQLGEYIELTLDDLNIQTKLLVAADGANSKVRRLANIGTTGWNYQQSAMLINVKTQLPQQNITWQQFLPTGPVAMLPMPADVNQLTNEDNSTVYAGCASLVWYQHRDEIKRLNLLNNAQLKQQILHVFPKRLGNIEVVAKGAFPLTRQHANQYVKGRVILLGDAAHSINPLAGQGVNLGFKDVLALQTIIAEAINEGECWFNSKVLARYEKMRRTDNLLMMTAMDSFYAAFSHPSTAIKFIRNSALFLINKSSLVKKQVLKHACGL